MHRSSAVGVIEELLEVFQTMRAERASEALLRSLDLPNPAVASKKVVVPCEIQARSSGERPSCLNITKGQGSGKATDRADPGEANGKYANRRSIWQPFLVRLPESRD